MHIPDSFRLRAWDLEALSGIRRAYIQRVLHIKNGYPQSVKKATDGVQFEVVLYYKHALFRAPNFHMENFKAYLEPYQFAVPLHYSLYLYTQSTLTWNGVYRIQVLNCALTHRSATGSVFMSIYVDETYGLLEPQGPSFGLPSTCNVPCPK